MLNQNVIQIIKLDYVKQLQEIFPKNSFAVRNLDKVINCKIIYSGNLAGHAVTNWEKNTITYGPHADECDIYHELDHIRKGQVYYAKDPEYVTEKNGKGFEESYISRAQLGVFFNEGITDYMAMYMFRNSRYFEPRIDQPKLDHRYYYSTQLEMIKLTAKKLGVSELEFCSLIDLKHHEVGNHDIDDMFQQKSYGMVNFKEFENRLDFWGTMQKFNLVRPDIRLSKTCVDEYNKQLSIANFMLEQIKTQQNSKEM
ncbi:MAG: hypothetical protein J6B20_02270 [Clostridia bacterium]|nr:hypothetical protein [Clostridia bacterium]